ncbi:Protein LMBR1L [Schistosoma japonicum]|nr:Protein LMBR1L [Schistosoma japonicum]KAH8877871.1 Protein LMBR1L [Schistosoma japonicum]
MFHVHILFLFVDTDDYMDQTDELVLISHEAKEFYDEIRGLVVVFLLFTILFFIAHITLQYFLSKTGYELKACRAERLAYQLVLGICTFTLTIGLTSYSLLPFTIITNEILIIFPQSYYVQWLNRELIQDLILLINIGCKISYLTIPFSYFLLNSQGFLHESHSFTSRLADSVIMVLFFYILCFGASWSLTSFVSALNYYFLSPISSFSASLLQTSTTFTYLDYYENHPVSFMQNSINSFGWIYFFQSICIQVIFMSALELIHMTASLLGLLLLFICTPVGLLSIVLNLITISIHSLPSLTTKQTLHSRIEQLNFEALTIVDDINCVQLLCTTNNMMNSEGNQPDHKSICFRNYTNIRSKDELLYKYLNELDSLNAEIVQIKQRINARRFLRFMRESTHLLFYFFCLILLFVLLRLLESFVFFNIIGVLWSMVFGNYGSKSGSSYSVSSDNKDHSSFVARSTDNSLTLGLKPVSSLGHIGAAFQVCLVLFLLVLSLWGFYSLPFARFLRPRYHATSLDMMLANIFLFLILSAALPLQTNLLGLTTLTLPSPLKTDVIISSTHSECSDMTCNTSQYQFVCSDKTSTCSNVKPIKKSSSWWTKLISGAYPFSWFSFIHKINPFSMSSPNSIDRSTITRPIQAQKQSIFRQFISRAFGYSSVSPSYGLGLVILTYNLCFLISSMWIAGRRLGDATLSISLDVVTTIRCLHQLDITSKPRPHLERMEWSNEVSCTNGSQELDRRVY